MILFYLHQRRIITLASAENLREKRTSAITNMCAAVIARTCEIYSTVQYSISFGLESHHETGLPCSRSRALFQAPVSPPTIHYNQLSVNLDASWGIILLHTVAGRWITRIPLSSLNILLLKFQQHPTPDALAVANQTSLLLC